MKSEIVGKTPIFQNDYPIEKLIPYARNSRTHSKEQIAQIAQSIKEFGFTNPILIDSQDGIIAGHARVMAAKSLNLSVVPVIRLGYLTEAQRKAYVIADNKLALNAGWDMEMLRLELEALRDLDYGLEMTGFGEDELLDILGVEESKGLTEDDDAPELSGEPPITQAGDVWLLGQHRLMCGDSTKKEDVARLMDGELADLLITDPPYNVEVQGGFRGNPERENGKKIQNDSMSDANFLAFLSDAFSAADSVMKKGAVFYIWHADSEGYNFRGVTIACGWELRQCLIWVKNTMVMGRQDYHWKHEPCLYGWKSGAAHLWAADRKQTTILNFEKPARNDVHPTMKPVALFEYQILNNTKGSDVVLDLFGGSGTTMIACQKTGRVSRLMELDPHYCDVIVKRWQDYTGETAVLSDK